MIEVSISEFRKNIKYYSTKVQDEDIIVINNGRPIMKIENPNKNRILIAKSLRGCIEAFDENTILEEKLKEL